MKGKSEMKQGSFTGRHMTGILVSFFGVVILVNFLMARFAVATFGGAVVDNSYVASQKFNGWLADARKQDALGWAVVTRLDAARRVHVSVSKSREPIADAALSATLSHPLGQAAERRFNFEETTAGEFVSRQPVPIGRWTLHLRFSSADGRYSWLETIR